MDIVEDHALSLEETFVYLVGIGKSKSDAYRAIVPCTGLSNELIASRAWKYSMKPSVLTVSANEQENLYAKYSRGRDIAFNTLIELTTDAQSEFVRQQSANALISQTAKLARLNIDVNLNVKSEMSDALQELRSILLDPTGETPQGFLPEGKKADSNNFQLTEIVPESNLNDEPIIETVLVLDDDIPGKVETVLVLDGKDATVEVIEEQLDGINPKAVRKGNGENCKVTGSTGNFKDAKSGKFVSNDTARDELAKMIKDKQDDFKNK